MTLIVCPAEGWDSLVSLDDAAEYMDNYGYTWPSYDTPNGTKSAEIALRKATQYLVSKYSIKHENLDPVVNRKVQAACCEAAHRALSGELVSDTDGRIVTEETTDVLTTKYAEGTQGGVMSYPIIESLLKGMLDDSDGADSLTIKMVRG